MLREFEFPINEGVVSVSYLGKKLRFFMLHEMLKTPELVAIMGNRGSSPWKRQTFFYVFMHYPNTADTSSDSKCLTVFTTELCARLLCLGTCESAVCVRIESRIESGDNIRIRMESSNRIFSTPTNINY